MRKGEEGKDREGWLGENNERCVERGAGWVRIDGYGRPLSLMDLLLWRVNDTMTQCYSVEMFRNHLQRYTERFVN